MYSCMDEYCIPTSYKDSWVLGYMYSCTKYCTTYRIFTTSKGTMYWRISTRYSTTSTSTPHSLDLYFIDPLWTRPTDTVMDNNWIDTLYNSSIQYSSRGVHVLVPCLTSWHFVHGQQLFMVAWTFANLCGSIDLFHQDCSCKLVGECHCAQRYQLRFQGMIL